MAVNQDGKIMSIQETAISLPFRYDNYGNIVKTNDQQKIWEDRVLSVVGTSIGERVMRSNFGTEIKEALFDTQTGMEEKVKDTVTKAFENFLPMLTLADITNDYDLKDNIMSVTITYALPNRQILVSTVPVTVGTISISGNKLPKEAL